MIKTPNLKETKTCLMDLISTHGPNKSSIFEKPAPVIWIQQPVSKPSTPNTIVYDNFIYTDKLTNKRIKMIDAKLSYEIVRNAMKSTCSSTVHNTQNREKKKRPSRVGKRNSKTELQKQLTDLNECFVMLKSTQMFKLNSLRQKIFRSIDRTGKQTSKETPNVASTTEIITEEVKDVLTKKNKIRQILQDSVKQANITQFRKYFSDQNHKLNNKILAMNKHIPRSFNKTNIEKIIDKLMDAENKDQIICNFIKKQQDNLQFPGQQKLRTELIDYMKKLIRYNGEYLITPQKNKLLYQRLYKNVGPKNNDLKNLGFDNTSTTNEISIKPSDQQSFDDEQTISKVNIDMPTQKTIFGPIVNEQAFVKKQNLWIKSLGNNQKLRDQNQKKKTQQLLIIDQKKKEKHKKQNSCINLTGHSKLKTKDSLNQSTKMKSFLNDFAFYPCEKNKEILMIKTKFQKNKKLKTTNLSLKEQKFLFMVENNLLFDVEKQILMNEHYLFIKDRNDNNLLHICAKNHSTEMLIFVIERYTKCQLKQEMREKWGQNILKDRLLEKNKHNKNVFEVAKLYHAEEIILYLTKLKEDLDIREQNS